MPRDEFVIPYGCMECVSIIPVVSDEGCCPRCGSIEIQSMDYVLQKLVEYDMFLQDMGIENFTDND